MTDIMNNKQKSDLDRAKSSVGTEKSNLSLESFPEEIIQHIFSFLPGKEGAATAIFSKTCWKYYPVLNLDSYYSRLPEEDFIKLVYDRLPSKPKIGTPKTLRMNAAFNFNEKDMNEWLQLKRIRNFTDLFLELRLFYRIPQTIFASGSLTVLHLKNCTLPEKILDHSTNLDSLQELHLTYVHSAGELIHHLEYICPSIVDLRIIVCKGINNIKLSSLGKLSKVDVKDYGDIKSLVIKSHTLHTFKYCGSNQDEKGCNIDVKNCRNLEVLHLQLTPSIAGFSLDICSDFPFLKTLSLTSYGPLERFKIASPVLQTLALRVIGEFVLDSPIDTPNLHSFTYNDSSLLSSKDSDVFPAMSSTPKEIKIKLSSPYEVDTSWFGQLRTFIGKLSFNLIQLSVEFNARKVTFEHDEELIKDASAHFPSPSVDVLKIKMCSKQENFSTLIDGLLWSCHPKTLSIPHCNHGIKQELMEALCHEFLNMEAKENCCRSEHTRCWRHYLKDAEFKQLFGAKLLKANFDMIW